MAITVKDIREKDFTKQVRGYSVDEVDDFLDEIASQMEMLIRENRALNLKLSEQSAAAPAAEPAPAPAAPAEPARDDTAYFRNLETTLRDTLVSANRVAEDTVNEAKKKAEARVAEAQEQAESIVADAKAEGSQLQAENDLLRSSMASYRENFLRIVKEQLGVLKADESILG